PHRRGHGGRASLEADPHGKTQGGSVLNDKTARERKAARRSFHREWSLSLVDPSGNRGLLLRFDLLQSRNSFHRVAQAWALHFQRSSAGQIAKVALKQSRDLDSFEAMGGPSEFKLGEVEFTSAKTRGKIESKGQSISWDLKIQEAQPSRFEMI